MTLPNAFLGKTEQPTDAELASTLGAAKKLWDQLTAELAAEYDVATREWHSYSRKSGWSLRLQREKRNIVYLIPHQGSFSVAFALGDKALKAARASGLPASVMKLLDEAKRYVEGTAVRMEVKGSKDIAVVKKLAVASWRAERSPPQRRLYPPRKNEMENLYGRNQIHAAGE